MFGECIRIPDFQRFNWKCRQCPTFHFSPFNCSLSVVLLLDKGAYPENSHVVLCHIKYVFFLTFHAFEFW